MMNILPASTFEGVKEKARKSDKFGKEQQLTCKRKR